MRTSRLLSCLAVVALVVLAGCTNGSVTGDPTPTDGPTTADPVAFAGLVLPDDAADLEIDPLSGDASGFRIVFTTATDADAICEGSGLQASLPFAADFTDEEREQYGLPADADGADARICTGMLADTNVQRNLIFVPLDADRLSVHVVAGEMPR